jgi:hypothetical protein
LAEQIETQEGEIKKNRFERHVDNVMRFNALKDDESYVFEDKNYGTKYTFFKDHAVVNEDKTDFEDVRYEYGTGENDFIEEIVEVSRKLDELTPAIPSGNLEGFGGKRELAKSILMVKMAEEYLSPKSDETK